MLRSDLWGEAPGAVRRPVPTPSEQRGALGVHRLAFMLVGGPSACNTHATSEASIARDRGLKDHLSEGGAADVAVAEDQDVQHPCRLADPVRGGWCGGPLGSVS